jgi:hypothetical protein
MQLQQNDHTSNNPQIYFWCLRELFHNGPNADMPTKHNSRTFSKPYIHQGESVSRIKGIPSVVPGGFSVVVVVDQPTKNSKIEQKGKKEKRTREDGRSIMTAASTGAWSC